MECDPTSVEKVVGVAFAFISFCVLIAYYWRVAELESRRQQWDE